MTTRAWQRIEGGLAFAALIGAVAALGAPWAWWWSVALFFLPDVSFAAYGAGPRVGAAVYNVLHLYGLGLALAVAGLIAGVPGLLALGLLMAAHVGFDRMLGYGLKEATGFRDTHLGQV